jgi:hypothetical protein
MFSQLGLEHSQSPPRIIGEPGRASFFGPFLDGVFGVVKKVLAQHVQALLMLVLVMVVSFLNVRSAIVIVFGHIDLLTVVDAGASGETAVPLHRILKLDWRAGHGHSPWLFVVLVLAFDRTGYFVPAHTVLSPALETRRSLSHSLIHGRVCHKLRGHLAFFGRYVDRKWLA